MTNVTFIRICVLIFLIGSIRATKHPNVIGGNNAVISDFPYLVSIRYIEDHLCGGTIISNRHILTAAHCFFDTEDIIDNITIHSGTSRANKIGNVHKILSVHIHPEFNISNSEGGYPHDIAVLTLKHPISFNKRQQKINLPNQDVQDYQVAYLVGWGMIRPKPTRRTAKQLQKLKVVLLPYDKCKPVLRHKMNPEQVCAYRSASTGACNGDSGGPLISRGAVVGIVSYGDVGKCAANAPDVYTNVFAYKDYIESIINE